MLKPSRSRPTCLRRPYAPQRRPRSALSTALAAVLLALSGLAAAGAGRLGPGDEQLASGEYFDRVTFQGAAGDEVVIELTSTEFDPYLIVLDHSETPLVQEDDTQGYGRGVRLTVRLPSAGTYTAIVTSAFSGETGGYRLTISTPAQAASGQVPPPTATTPTVPTVPAPASQPRTVTGTAVDTLGRPIAGARVWIQPSLTTGLVETRTDASGRYVAQGLIDVPYTASAWAYVDYGGRSICMRLGMEAPVDYDSFVPTQGAVRNFVMQLTGPIEDLRDLDEHFGGMIRVMYALAYAEGGNRIEFTFTPQGPLIDGTSIAPFTRVMDPSRDEDIHGIPVGPYRVTAVLIGGDGSRRPLGLTLDSFADPQPFVDVDWTGDGSCDSGSGFDWVYVYLEFPE